MSIDEKWIHKIHCKGYKIDNSAYGNYWLNAPNGDRLCRTHMFTDYYAVIYTLHNALHEDLYRYEHLLQGFKDTVDKIIADRPHFITPLPPP